MALLDTTQRFRTCAQLIRDHAFPNLVKADVRAALNAADQWVEDNTSSYVVSLPQPFRNNTTAVQKAVLLAYVLWRRIGMLRTQED